MKLSFGKDERLKSRKLIGQLFEEGSSFFCYPFKIVYIKTDVPIQNYPCKTAISVSKRLFKNAPDRNKVKRLFRETFRKQKRSLYDALNLTESNLHIVMWIYVGKKIPEYEELFNQTGKGIEKLTQTLSSKSTK